MKRRHFFRTLVAPAVLPLASRVNQVVASNVSHEPQGQWPAPDDPNYWRWIRQQFLIPPDEAFFNTGTLGACPRQVVDVVTRDIRQIEETLAHWDYRPENPDWFSGYRPQAELREKLGKVIHASAHEVALTQNATMGMNFMALGLNLQPGDEVLSTNQEHPGGRCGWEMRAQREGIIWRPLEVPIPPPDPEAIIRIFAEAITPRTRVIAIPHITSMLGIVMPVRQICALARPRGIFTIIDGAQAVGQLHVNVKEIGCDAYFSSPHKWLLAPPGNGFLYIRQEKLGEAWTTLCSSEWNNYRDGAYRLMQYGTGNLSLLRGLEAAIDFHLKIGPDRVEKRIVGLANRLREGLQKIKGVTILSPVHPALAGAMITYRVDAVTGPQLMDEMWKRKIRVRSMGNENGVRQSVHIYNSPEEIDATVDVVRMLAANHA
ncbi:MAG: aminotransferase class V-fold PLP-dependent enzyme [Acidobacteria bacterium]|nr:aminotransferase class V-fold PLP-dependent enzyme [Acidobacteriota bacterium]